MIKLLLYLNKQNLNPVECKFLQYEPGLNELVTLSKCYAINPGEESGTIPMQL